MEVIDNISRLLGDDLKGTVRPGAKVRIAASSFSIYAFEALKQRIGERRSSANSSSPRRPSSPKRRRTRSRKPPGSFIFPKPSGERGFHGSEFEIRLKNKLTQRAIARECAEWIRRKAQFRSNRSGAPMQQFACVEAAEGSTVYMPLHGFTAVDLGYQQGNAVSNFVNKMDEPVATRTFLALFDQIWQDSEKLTDVTDLIRDHIASVYKENSPQRIYFLMLFSIFSEFLQDINEDVLPNERTGYQESAIWQKLYSFQRDAATGIINKLETYNGCILADSVGLGKTFTALAVIKYYELRNRTVLVLCPKKLADNWTTYKGNLKNNPLVKDRFSYDVLCHTDLLRDRGESLGMRLSQVNWSNYDLVVIDESHNFRNDDAFKDRETRYQRLMNRIVRQGVRTKVLMLSATPVNNRFNDLKNQLALAYEGEPENLKSKLKHRKEHRSDLPPGADRLQCLVKTPRRAAHTRGDSLVSGFRLLRASGCGHHRPLPAPHHDLLRHEGNWRVSHPAQAALVPLAAHQSDRRDGLQSDLFGTGSAQAWRLHAGLLHPAQPRIQI